MRGFFCFFLLLISLAPGRADAETLEQVLQPDTVTTVEGYKDDADTVTPTAVSDSSVPFKSALKVTRKKPSDISYAAAMLWVTRTNIKKGDLLVATFYVRNTSSKNGPLRLDVTFQLKDEPYTPTLVTTAPVDTEAWRKYAVPFRAIRDYPAGGSTLQARYSLAAQSFEIGGVAVANYGQVQNPIPKSIAESFAYYYPDRGNAQAAWRVAALKRIEALRKGEMTLRVVDQKGQPVPNATVKLVQIQLPFVWSTASSAISLTCKVDADDGPRPCPTLDQQEASPVTPDDYRRLRKELLANFNGASFYNDLKWTDWHNDQQLALDGIAWMKRNKLPLSRGHALIWPSFEPGYLMPQDIINRKTSPEEARRVIAKHFAQIIGTLKGQIPEWDVINEPFTNTDIQGRLASTNVKAIKGLLPVSIVAEFFKNARKVDPTALLFLNDFSILDNLNPAKLENDVALVKLIKKRGGPVDGIGFQGHFGASGPVFTDMQKSIDAFAPLVKTMSVTEFDFETLDPALQRDLTNDVMTFIYSQPKFSLFQIWGFWDGDHWLGNGPLFNRDWSLKPSGEVWQTLTQKTWRTTANAVTDRNGETKLRAFYGTYKVSVTSGDKTCETQAKFLRAGELVVTGECK
jgi:endo-1,4-beta-xylanase